MLQFIVTVLTLR